MRRLKKTVAIVLVAVMVYSLIPNFCLLVFAAPAPLKINVVDYSNGTLNISWNAVANATSGTLTYYTPKAGGGADPNTAAVDVTQNKATITGLKENYIYKFDISIIDGAIGAAGSLFFLPQVSFNSQIVNQQPGDVVGGGSETGIMPTLKLSWNMPMVYDGVSDFVYAYKAFNLIDPQITKLSYTVNISDSLQRSDIKLKYMGVDGSNDPVYKATVSGDSDVDRISDVKFNSSSGLLYFYLLGKKDEAAYLATKTEVMANLFTTGADAGKKVIPDDISSIGENNFVLPDSEILPGSVYMMKINPLFTDNVGGYLDVVSFGVNGSSLEGLLPYTYTPMRFELTKDSANNVYVKIYKVNEGSLSLPRLYYYVETCSVPSNDDSMWSILKRLDDSYFTGSFAYTVLSGINANNTLYYRIVVGTDSGGSALDSLKMPYTIKSDTSKPPVPKGIEVVKKELVSNTEYQEKSTDITLVWDKPDNWDQIRNHLENDIYFHFLLNTAQNDLTIEPDPMLEASGKNYGNFPVKYRLIKYISANSTKIDDSGTKLKYVIKGFELFKWEDAAGNVNNIPNDENYPTFLLPGKVYYLQMYTTKAVDAGTTDPVKMSDRSLTISFTTLINAQRDVPLPGNFKITKNDIDSTSKLNYVEFQFDKINIDWANYTSNHSQNDIVYYDIYMSTRTETSSFVRIGTTQYRDRDIVFLGDTDSQSIFIKAKISIFHAGINTYDPDNDPSTNNDIDPYTIFGDTLLPNTTYYFMIKARLVMENPPNPPNTAISRESLFTAILPVTTIRGSINPPDETSKRPLAPTDFAVARDSNGNLMLAGQSVTFGWTKKESGVTYTLICTSVSVTGDASTAAYASDFTYQSFIKSFGSTDSDSDNSKLTLDIAANPLQNNLEYDSTAKTCKFTIDKWLFPNKLYYFSIRAEAGSKVSAWVSIPVTTSLIEGPTLLEPVNDSELGFYWSDTSPNMKADDYKIYMKETKDIDYKMLSRAQCTVVKDGNNYYGRVFNLKSKTSYDIKVYKGGSSPVVVYQKTGMTTKNDDHEIEVMWKGLPVDPYAKFEVVIKAADDTDYTTLSDEDMEFYTDNNVHTFPYYIDKTLRLAGTSYGMYHAKIKSVMVTLADGTKEKQLLRSNTKYYIKVRGVKIDPADTTLISYSKYIGPVETRTEFNQSDYDSQDQDTKQKAIFMDRISKLEEGLYWKLDMENVKADKILLKGDRLSNAIENSQDYGFVLDISSLGQSVNTDYIYVPVSIIKTLKTSSKSLTIKTFGAEYTLSPKTLDLENIIEIADVQNKQGVKDLFLKLAAERSDSTSAALPAGTKKISKVFDFEIQAIGSYKTDTDLKNLIYNKIYDNETGLVKNNMNILLHSDDRNGAKTPQEVDRYISGLIGEVENELSDYIEGTIEGTDTDPGMIAAVENVRVFSNPLLVKLTYISDPGLKSPYVNYDGEGTWKKLMNHVSHLANSITFDAAKSGKYVVLSVQNSANNIREDYWVRNSIVKFMTKYDLNNIFTGVDQSFNPEITVSGGELVLLYEKVMGKAGQNTGLDVRQKARKLGLDSIISLNGLMNDVTKEETASVMVKIYSVKLGINADNLKLDKTVPVKDELDMGLKYYKASLICIDSGILTLDENNNFNPKTFITRAELVSAFTKLLELTGDL